jgi:hypothetical protein
MIPLRKSEWILQTSLLTSVILTAKPIFNYVWTWLAYSIRVRCKSNLHFKCTCERNIKIRPPPRKQFLLVSTSTFWCPAVSHVLYCIRIYSFQVGMFTIWCKYWSIKQGIILILVLLVWTWPYGLLHCLSNKCQKNIPPPTVSLKVRSYCQVNLYPTVVKTYIKFSSHHAFLNNLHLV